MEDEDGAPIDWLDILASNFGEWIVLYRDCYFPDDYPGYFLHYAQGSVISRGNRLPIAWAKKMRRTGRRFDPNRYNGTITMPPEKAP